MLGRKLKMASPAAMSSVANMPLPAVSDLAIFALELTGDGTMAARCVLMIVCFTKFADT